MEGRWLRLSLGRPCPTSELGSPVRKPLVPHAISLETPHFTLRTLEPSDATDAWGTWLSDPDTLRNLNVAASRLDAAMMRAYIEQADRVHRHVLGIFRKDDRALIGVRTVYVDPVRRSFLDNVIIGEPDARGKGALVETSAVMNPYFFEVLDLDLAEATVVASNEGMVRFVEGRMWVRTRTSMKPAASGAGQVTIYHYCLPRPVWRKREGRDTPAA